MKTIAIDALAGAVLGAGGYSCLVLVWPDLARPDMLLVAMALTAVSRPFRQARWMRSRPARSTQPAGRPATDERRSAARRLAGSEAGRITIAMLLLKSLLALLLSGIVLAIVLPWAQSRGAALPPWTPWIVVGLCLALLFAPDVRRGLGSRQ